MPIGVTVKTNKLDELKKLVDKLTSKQVLIGIPAENAPRGDGGEINNAAIGYLMETGCPERNIPARPHLVPGIREAAPRAVNILKIAAKKLLTVESRPEDIEGALEKVGMICVSEVKTIIQSKIPPPLADSTLKARAARAGNAKKGVGISKGAIKELKMRAEKREKFGADFMPDSVFVTPLIDSGQYISKITSVVRNRTK